MLFVNIIAFIDREHSSVATMNFSILEIKRFANIRKRESSCMMRHMIYEL